MKLSVPLILILLMVSCKTEKKTEAELVEDVKIESLEVKDIVSYLASDELKGRDTDTKEIDKAANFIAQKFRMYNVNPYFETYRDAFEFELRNRDSTSTNPPKIKKGYNVVGYIEGTDDELKREFIILGAHYDHIGFSNVVEGDSIANGANDNAAGSAAVLSLARYFAERKSNKRSLLFCLFSAEEYGLRGSKHLAEQLNKNGLNLYTMVNFEMIGVPMKNRDYKAYLTGFEKSNMADKINGYASNKIVGFLPQAKNYQLFRRSDNYPFFKQFEKPCQTVSTFDFTNFEHYHKVGDESELMNFDFMAALINDIAPAIEKMSQTPTQEIKLNED